MYWKDRAGAPRAAEPAHLRALGNEMRERYLASGALAGKSDLDKQTAADWLMVSACIPLITYTNGKRAGDEAAKHNSRQTAGRLLSTLRLSPTSVRFNPNGSVQVSPRSSAWTAST